MAITYPLTAPTTPSPRSGPFRNRAAVAASRSPFTFEEQVQVRQGMLWAFSVDLPPMSEDDAAEWVAFLHELNGREGTFLMTPPGLGSPRGNPVGTPLVDSAASPAPNQARDRTLVTDGWTFSATGVLKKRDLISIGSGAATRVYMVLDDVDADGAGAATFDIWPRLRETPTDNAAITTSSPKGTFRLATNEMAFTVELAQIYGISFDVVEAL